MEYDGDAISDSEWAEAGDPFNDFNPKPKKQVWCKCPLCTRLHKRDADTVVMPEKIVSKTVRQPRPIVYCEECRKE